MNEILSIAISIDRIAAEAVRRQAMDSWKRVKEIPPQ